MAKCLEGRTSIFVDIRPHYNGIAILDSALVDLNNQSVFDHKSDIPTNIVPRRDGMMCTLFIEWLIQFDGRFRFDYLRIEIQTMRMISGHVDRFVLY